LKKSELETTTGHASLCENSELVILENEKAVQIIFTENKNAP